MRTLWRIKPRHVYLWSTSVATWHILFGYGLSIFRSFTSFYIFIIFGLLCACLGIKKAFAAYLILWKRGARWRVV